jgi:hypothetical protein
VGFISSIVWFKPANYGHNLWDGLVYFSFLDFIFKPFRTVGKREIDLICRATVFNDQVASEQVQSSPQIVDCVPDDYGKSDWDGFDLLRFQEVLSCLRVYIGDNSIRISADKGADFGIEIRDVLFGPFNL